MNDFVKIVRNLIFQKDSQQKRNKKDKTSNRIIN